MGCLTEKKVKETFRGKRILWRKGLFIQTWFIVPSSICYCMWACKHFPSAINCKRTQPSTYSRYVQCTMYIVQAVVETTAYPLHKRPWLAQGELQPATAPVESFVLRRRPLLALILTLVLGRGWVNFSQFSSKRISECCYKSFFWGGRWNLFALIVSVQMWKVSFSMESIC